MPDLTPTPIATPNPRGGARPGAGARPKNMNALGTGARSRRLQPILRAAGPEGRAVILRAISRALHDALAHAPTGPTRAEASARTAARHHAFRRILNCLRAADFTHPSEHGHAMNLALTFAPIWLSLDATPPPSDQPTIKPASAIPPTSCLPSPIHGRGAGGEGVPTLPLASRGGERGPGGEGSGPGGEGSDAEGSPATPATPATPARQMEIRYPVQVPNTTHTIYLDSAASTPVRAEALAAMLPYFSEQYANPSGHYAAARRAADALATARDQVAAVLNCLPEEVVFTSGGTESINAAVKGVAIAQREAGVGSHIVTTAIEHHAVLHTMQYLERFGYEVELVPVDEYGRVSPEDIAAAVREDTVLVSVMYANNEVGTIQPIAAIARAVRARAEALGRRIPFHTDAVQAPNSLPLDVEALGVDLLSLSGHKFGGPKGTGVLYIRRGTAFLEQMSGGGQERQRRSGTEDVPGAVGMATALQLAQSEREAFHARTTELRARLLDGLRAACPEAVINGHPTENLPHAVHLCFDGIEGEAAVEALDALGIECSAGAACTSATWEPSHVLLAMGIPLERAIGSLRLTLWPTLTEADIDYVVATLPGAVQQVRLASLPAI